MTTEIDIDTNAVEEFAGRMIGIVDNACAALMISIGHQVGLFDAMEGRRPETSQEVADTAGLHERYVREWLAAMTTARIVRHDPGTATYWLPPEHAASLTRSAGPDNIASMAQFVALLASVEEPVVECFSRGGGVPYSAYPKFHRLMAEDSARVNDAALVDGVLPMVPGLTDRLGSGIDVADIGCGQGHAVNLMAAAFPSSRFTGYDFSEEAITAARDEAERLGLTNASFELQDVAEPGVEQGFDLVTAFDAIHDQAHPAHVLSRVASALRPDGTFFMVDIRASSHVHENLEIPWGTFLYTASTMHCMTVSLALDGDGLGTAWGEQLAVSMLRDAGFTEVVVKSLDEDAFNSYYVATKG